MAKVESIAGPVTLEISEWFSRFEESFEASAATLTKKKILAAGSAVAKSQHTKSFTTGGHRIAKRVEGKPG
jgi:hypothetical protein